MTKSLYEKAIIELFKIRNPQISIDGTRIAELEESINNQVKKEDPKVKIEGKPLTKKAVFELSTGRNKNLITTDDQNRLRKTVVAFFGMSVGANAAVTWVLLSRADIVKIVDPDIISASNLNRIKAGWKEIGRKKVDFVEDEIQNISPYSTIIKLDSVKKSEIEAIFNTKPIPDIIVDEIDAIEDKIFLRVLARKSKIPVISAADVGDNIVLDIERFDLDNSAKIFLGRVKDIENIDFSHLPEKEKKKLIIKLVGFEVNSEKLLNSLFGIGSSIPTWPQLGSTATIAGGVVASTIKKIILNEKVLSGRYYFSLDDILVQNFNDLHMKQAREIKISAIKRFLNKNND